VGRHQRDSKRDAGIQQGDSGCLGQTDAVGQYPRHPGPAASPQHLEEEDLGQGLSLRNGGV